MDLLKARILKDGQAINEHVLKVDSFLNHQVDPVLINAVGQEFARYFADSLQGEKIDKVVTIESSGIAPAMFTAAALGVPLLILKKQASRILNSDVYQAQVHSFTKDLDYQLTVAKKYLQAGQKVLMIDDFLANGQAALGVLDICKQADVKLLGIGIVIEKSFQEGRALLEAEAMNVYSLARISKLSAETITFAD